MLNTYTTVNVHVRDETAATVERLPRDYSGHVTQWLQVGPVTMFADDASLARIAAAIADHLAADGYAAHYPTVSLVK